MAGTILLVSAVAGAASTAYSAYEGHKQGKKAEEEGKQQLAAMQAEADNQQAKEEKARNLESHALQRRRSIATQVNRRGRASTILSDIGGVSQTLGGSSGRPQ